MTTRTISVADVAVERAFVRADARERVFNIGNEWIYTVHHRDMNRPAPLTGYGLWVENGIQPNHHVCFPTPLNTVEYITSRERFEFRGRSHLASVTPASNIVLCDVGHTPCCEVRSLVDVNVFCTLDVFPRQITSLVVRGPYAFVASHSVSPAPKSLVVFDLDTTTPVFFVNDNTISQALPNDHGTVIHAIGEQGVKLFDMRVGGCVRSLWFSAETILGLPTDNILAFCDLWTANFLDLRIGGVYTKFEGANFMTWNRYHGVLCGTSRSGKRVAIFNPFTNTTEKRVIGS